MIIQIADFIESPTTQAIARLLAVLLDIGGGTYFCLLGFGVIKPKRNLEQGQRILKKYGLFFRLVGLMLVFRGLVGLSKLI
jgi:hypothetical protein